MIIEALEIGAIFACCGILTWTAMRRCHSKIETRLDEIQSHNTELKMTEKRFRK